MVVDKRNSIKVIAFSKFGMARRLFVLFLGFHSTAFAGDLKLNTGVSASLVDQQINTKDSPKQTINATNLIIKPYASLNYQAKDFNVFFRGTHNQVRRELDGETITQGYTEYNYSGGYDIIENLLEFSVSGAKRYSSNSLNSFLVDDFLLNSDSLNKISFDGANLRLNIRRGQFFGLSASTSYTHTLSEFNDSSFPNTTGFDNESFGANFSAITGEGLDGARISLSSSMQYSKRGNGQDFVSQLASLSADFKLIGNFGLSLNGTYENNEFKTEFSDVDNGLREFYSVGTGFNWEPRNDRFIKLLLNRYYSSSPLEGEADEEDTFLSTNINWAFSTRTSIQGSFSRRFFGNAGNLSFSHQLRNWRSSITYTEIVSSNSQLINSNSLGLFICDNGSTDIADCRLSDTLEPQLEQGESIQPFIIQNPVINDRVLLRKSLIAQTAVTRRRTTLSLSAVRSQDEEVEINRIIDSSTIRTSVNFSLSHNTNLQYSFSASKNELDTGGNFEEATTKRHSIELNRKITRRFTASVGLSYLDRDGEITRGTQSLRGLNGPLTDRRITFRISYDLGTN